MSHDHPHDESELEFKYRRLLQMAEHMRHVLVELKSLVPKAFEEGFKRRVPDTEEPWLVDWLQSDTKARLETIAPKPKLD